MHRSARRVVVVAVVMLAACGGSPPPPTAAPVRAPAPSLPAPTASPAAASTPSQVFADEDPGLAFLDPDRRTKLAAAFPAIDTAIADEMKQQNVPGLAVGIVIDGELAYAKGFGVADLDSKTAPTPDTVYRIGSITKSFTGLSILALRDAGALDLDDPLTRWIPEASGITYPSRDARPITLRQLATHTSGLPRMGPFDGEHGPDEATVVKSLAKVRLETAPGTANTYSNLGFELLGIVASHAAHKPYHDVVRDFLLAPLGMTSTYWDHDDVPKGRLATTYPRMPEPAPRPTTPARLGAGDGAGGIYSSVRDMARYAAFQLAAYPPRNADDTGALRRATVREAHSTGFPAGAGAGLAFGTNSDFLVELHSGSYGFGWVAAQTCELDDLVWHNGAIDSFRSDLRMLTDRGVAVIVLTNFAHASPDRFSERIIHELAATNALAKRAPRMSPALTTAMDRILAVYNTWDEAAYKAMLDPTRGPIPEEKDELAGYKALHGTCTSATPLTVDSPTRASFKLACERGAFTMRMDIVPASGLIGGFIGESHDVTAPADLQKTATVLAALIGKWDAAAYTRALPKARHKAADAKKVFDALHATHGSCKITGAGHEGFDWQFQLACERGGNPVLALNRDLMDKTLVDMPYVRMTMRPGERCPRR